MFESEVQAALSNGESTLGPAVSGLTDAVIAPGSRSAPLALALHSAASAPGSPLRLHVRIDERSASFLALGLAKAHGQPVAIVTTSGTAAAHCHAAVIEADESGGIRRFLEKPLEPPGTPDDPDATFVSMGNYIFTTKVLIDAIRADADDDHSDHDMGGDIIPRLVNDGMAAVYDFNDNDVPGATDRDRAYWRDVGTLDAFYDAHMDLVSVHPVFNLYNKRWPIRGESENLAPAKFVNGGSAQESVVGAGSIISASSVRNSVLSSNVVVDDGAIVEGSVIMPGTRVGRGAVVRHAILDKNVVVGPGEMVGVDLERDRERFAISAGGVVAVGKGVWI